MVSVVLRGVLQLSSTATGASATGVTVMVTVARLEVDTASLAWYVNVSVPFQLATGTYAKLPSALNVKLAAWAGLVSLVAVSVSPSRSVSLWSTPAPAPMVRLVSSLVV